MYVVTSAYEYDGDVSIETPKFFCFHEEAKNYVKDIFDVEGFEVFSADYKKIDYSHPEDNEDYAFFDIENGYAEMKIGMETTLFKINKVSIKMEAM